MDLPFSAQDFISITTQFLEKWSSTDLDLFYMIAWTIWGNRNNAIHNDAGCPSAQAWAIAKQSQIDFTTSCSHDHPFHPTIRTHWSLPPPGFHKINVDGATANDGGRFSIGVIIRDHTSATIGAFKNSSHRPSLPLSLRRSHCIKEFPLLQKWERQKLYSSLMP